MTLTFSVRLTIGNDLRNQTTVSFGLDYDPSTNDYEEFAKHTGWDNAYDMLINGNEEFEEEIKSDLKNDNCSCLDYYLDRYSTRQFENFLVNKYQDKVEQYLVDNIEINLDKDLNDILS